jgi:hypothetical protein
MSSTYTSAQYKQTNPENHLSKPDLAKINKLLSKDEQKVIKRNCENIESNIRQARKESGSQAKAMFGRSGSMEVLSRLGIFMAAQELAEGDPNKLNLRKPSVIADLLDNVD